MVNNSHTKSAQKRSLSRIIDYVFNYLEASRIML